MNLSFYTQTLLKRKKAFNKKKNWIEKEAFDIEIFMILLQESSFSARG